MEVTIIGEGNMGRGIGTRLVTGGNKVKIIDQDPDQATHVAEELASAGAGSAEGEAAGDALNPIDAGPLKRARELERLGFLHMAIQEGLGTGYRSAVKIVR